MEATKDTIVINDGSKTLPKVRESNIELFRIIAMLLVVLHHFVLHSGFGDMYDMSHITANMVLLQMFGAFGKFGINCFTVITGYYMIKSNWKLKKFLKLYLEILFYNFGINLLLLMCGYQDSFTPRYIITHIFLNIFSLDSSYPATMLMMYLLIPFMNLLAKHMSKKQYLWLLSLLLFGYSIISTFSIINNVGDYISWLCIVYMVGGYIRLYPCKLFESKWIAGLSAFISIGLMLASIVVVDFVGVKLGFDNYYEMCGVNKILPLIGSVSLFVLFLNIHIKPSRIINCIASATFGVYLIHDNNGIMRQWLWKDFLHNTTYYDKSYLIPYMLGVVLAIFAVCVIIDLVRQYLLEKPIFKLYDKIEPKMKKTANKVCDCLMKPFGTSKSVTECEKVDMVEDNTRLTRVTEGTPSTEDTAFEVQEVNDKEENNIPQ